MVKTKLIKDGGYWHGGHVGGGGYFGPFTLSLSLEKLSASLSQDELLSVPNGAARGRLPPFIWLLGDVALLPLQAQNHGDTRCEFTASVGNVLKCSPLHQDASRSSFLQLQLAHEKRKIVRQSISCLLLDD